MTRPLVYSPAFIRAVKRAGKGNPAILRAVARALALLEADAYDPRLRTHKLRGDLSGTWSCSAGYDLRILFEFTIVADVESILLVTFGAHDEVY